MKETKLKKQKTELERKKQMLHNLIDSLTEADYVSLSSNIDNLTGDAQKLYKIIIEVNGNVIITPSVHPFFDKDE